jgi:hypothetical protein
MLEQNIQIALKTQQITLDDAIDIREIRNLKLANEVLKVKGKQKQKQDQAAKQANIQAQAEANSVQAERAAMAEMQKQQALADTELQIEKGKSEFAINKMQQEAVIKQQLMQVKFGFDKQLKEMELKTLTEKENLIEDRKDKRTRIAGTQQSKMIDQRKNDLLPTDFEENQSTELLEI